MRNYYLFTLVMSISVEIFRSVYLVFLSFGIFIISKVSIKNLVILLSPIFLGLIAALYHEELSILVDNIKLCIGFVTFILFKFLYKNQNLERIVLYIIIIITFGLLFEAIFFNKSRPSFLFYEPGYTAPLLMLAILTSFFTGSGITKKILILILCFIICLLTKSLFSFGVLIFGSFLLLPKSVVLLAFFAIPLHSGDYSFQLWGRILEVFDSKSLSDFLSLMGNRHPRLVAGIEHLDLSILPLGLSSYKFFEQTQLLPPNGLFIELSLLLGLIPGICTSLYLLYLMIKSLKLYKSLPLLLFYSYLMFYAVFETVAFKFYFWAVLGIIFASTSHRVRYGS